MNEQAMRAGGHVFDPGVKVGIVIAWLVVTFLASFTAATLLTSVAAELIAVFAVLALVAFTSRTFRTRSEFSDDRPWWQLTSRTASAFMLAILFGASPVVELAVGSTNPAISAVAQLFFAAAYIGSGVGQSIRKQRADRPKG